MIELTRVILENEMDLILAHKQSMRLAELSGLSLSSQTTFATAVSEVCRSTANRQTASTLTLYISDKIEKVKFIIAVLEDKSRDAKNEDGYSYAKRLVQTITVTNTPSGTLTELKFRLPQTIRIDDSIIEKWRISMNTDPAVSPYEEIKRNNRQLIELADKLRASEQQFKMLTDSLPLMIYSMDTEGNITYANQWLGEYTGQDIDKINATRWESIIHPDDYTEIWANWKEKTATSQTGFTIERRLRQAGTGEYRWHTGSVIAMTDENEQVRSWNIFMADIHAQKMIEETRKDNIQLKAMHAELQEKINQLNHSNQQLEQFAYVASHDLQEPLRKISFYSDFFKQKYAPLLPAEAGTFLDNLVTSTSRMRMLIQDVLAYSIVRRDSFTDLNLNNIATEVMDDLEIGIREKKAVVTISDLPVIQGNARQIKQLFENLVSNSLKFSRVDITPVISITSHVAGNKVLLSFTDNGIGFEDQYLHKMFDLFQRLHSKERYNGTGIGLALCKKIADVHNGSIVAKGEPGKGATFVVELPLQQTS